MPYKQSELPNVPLYSTLKRKQFTDNFDKMMTYVDTYIEETDQQDTKYPIIENQSGQLLFFGSGGILGKGFLNGSQSYLDYLPEKHTDFIFTLFSEEFGFIGSIVLLFIYVLIIYRVINIGKNAKNDFASLYCFGFATAFFVYVVINMAMVLGLVPIVGAPLPIMSYGGSAMLSIMIGLSIVMSCRIHNHENL